MGKEVASVAGDFDFAVVGGLDQKEPKLSSWLSKQASSRGRPDVVIDFSLPEVTAALAKDCAASGIPLVSGVTGLSDGERRALEEAAKHVPVLYSANMSIGIQLLSQALSALKGAEGFDISIEEVHHRHKRDRPSGTALLLADELKIRTGRTASEIVSLRGGGVLGEHRVLALSDSETLVFEHTALNRAVFARGACRAARWILGRSPGLYSLRDALLS